GRLDRGVRLGVRGGALADPLRRDARLPALRLVPDRLRWGRLAYRVLRLGRVVRGLALHPGQAGLAPAADAVAMLVGVLVALEAFEHVVALAPARLRGGLRSAV